MGESDQIEDAIREGKIIYSDYVKRMRGDAEFANLDYQAKYEYYMKIYIDYARQNPMILRMIASYGMFSEKAIRMYFKKCFNKPIKTDEDYCERQADFVKYNYMFCGKHIPAARLNIIWANTKKSMMEEVEFNKKETKETRDRRAKNKKENDSMRRDNLKKAIALAATSGALPTSSTATP